MIVLLQSTNGQLINDFQVNENGGGCYHGYHDIAQRPQGDFVVVFQDYRNGYPDIFAQCYNANGEAIGNNFQINQNGDRTAQYELAVATNTNGTTVVAWKDFRRGTYDIWAQLFTLDGSFIGGNFLVNDDSALLHHHPSVGIDGNDNFVITWMDTRGYGKDVYAQRYSSDGTPLGSNFLVNDADTNSRLRIIPKIVLADSGDFIITWSDNRTGNYDVYFQKYSSDGSPIDSNITVNDDNSGTQQKYPSISQDEMGNSIVAWDDYRNGEKEYYAQYFNYEGIPVGNNVLININDYQNGGSQIEIELRADSTFIAAWWEEDSNGYDVYAQLFEIDGSSIGDKSVVHDYNSFRQVMPAIASNSSGDYIICWNDDRYMDVEIFAQRFNNDGTPIGQNFEVNDDIGSSSEHDPVIAVDSNGRFIIAWIDSRNHPSEIYAQRYDEYGNSLGNNFLVSTETYTKSANHVSLTVESTGNFVVVWKSEEIYGQLFDQNGNTIGDIFTVNNDTSDYGISQPLVGMNGSGNFIIIWEMQNDLYCREYTSDGNPIADQSLLCDNGVYGELQLSRNESGEYVIVYNASSNIYALRYDNNSTLIGESILVNDDSTTASKRYPDVAIAQEGNFIVAWHDTRNIYSDIYAQLFSADGQAIGTNILASIDGGVAYQTDPAVAVDENGIFSVTWEDSRDGNSHIYGQLIDSIGSLIGENFRISSGELLQYKPDVEFNDGKIYSTWQDNRIAGQGWDIWSNVLNLIDIVSIDNINQSRVPAQIIVYQNYPNPFNPITTIQYELPQRSDIQITIYDLLGRKVSTLVSATQDAGFKSVSWNATNATGQPVSAGVYFYQIRVYDPDAIGAGNFIETRKMMMLK